MICLHKLLPFNYWSYIGEGYTADTCGVTCGLSPRAMFHHHSFECCVIPSSTSRQETHWPPHLSQLKKLICQRGCSSCPVFNLDSALHTKLSMQGLGFLTSAEPRSLYASETDIEYSLSMATSKHKNLACRLAYVHMKSANAGLHS